MLSKCKICSRPKEISKEIFTSYLIFLQNIPHHVDFSQLHVFCSIPLRVRKSCLISKLDLSNFTTQLLILTTPKTERLKSFPGLIIFSFCDFLHTVIK